MLKTKSFLLLCSFSLFFSCIEESGYKFSSGIDRNSGPVTGDPDGGESRGSFADFRSVVTGSKCSSCHATFAASSKGGGHDFFMSEQEWRESYYIIAGDPESSPIYESLIKDENEFGFMPKNSSPLSERELEKVRAWIENLDSSNQEECGTPDSAGASVRTGEAVSFFRNKCISCHNNGGQPPNLDLSSDQDFLAEGSLVKRRIDLSSIYFRLKGSSDVSSGPKTMPSNGSVTANELKAVRDWICKMP